MGCRISGWGKALPRRVVTNDELSTMVDTSDAWIVERTGIRQRRIAVEESSCDLAAAAAHDALERAGLSAGDIDLIVCMTITPDATIPSQACLVKARIGAENAVAFDLNAACTGCIYGIEVAQSMLEVSAADAARAKRTGAPRARNAMRRALVVGVERLSRIVDWNDRATCVLFGDGAGAVVLEWSDTASGILASFLKNTDDSSLTLACASRYDASTFPFAAEGKAEGGSNGAVVANWEADGTDPVAPIAEQEVESGTDGRPVSLGEPWLSPDADLSALARPFVSMQGQRVFKFATAAMVEAVNAVLERSSTALDDIALIVPHQANERIIKYAAKKLGVSPDLFQISIGKVGNTSASSVLMALSDAFEAGRIAPGDKLILVGFGGGLTSGAILLEA